MSGVALREVLRNPNRYLLTANFIVHNALVKEKWLQAQYKFCMGHDRAHEQKMENLGARGLAVEGGVCSVALSEVLRNLNP